MASRADNDPSRAGEPSAVRHLTSGLDEARASTVTEFIGVQADGRVHAELPTVKRGEWEPPGTDRHRQLLVRWRR